MKKEEWKRNGSKVTSDRFNFTIYPNRGNATITRSEAEQVAKRMAACDDLLEAVIKMCEYHEMMATWDKGDNGYYKAKAAIKKATK